MQESSAPSLARLLLLSGLALAGLVVVGVFAWHYFNDIQAVAAGIERARPWLAAWRAALFISLVGLWPRLINVLADRYGWSDAQRQHVCTQRWRVATWLIVIELVLVQNLIGKFVNGLVS
jgi:hypothetical protein